MENKKYKMEFEVHYHANYLQWMLEVVPEDIYLNYHLAALKITYKKAATYGSRWIHQNAFFQVKG